MKTLVQKKRRQEFLPPDYRLHISCATTCDNHSQGSEHQFSYHPEGCPTNGGRLAPQWTNRHFTKPSIIEPLMRSLKRINRTLI